MSQITSSFTQHYSNLPLLLHTFRCCVRYPVWIRDLWFHHRRAARSDTRSGELSAVTPLSFNLIGPVIPSHSWIYSTSSMTCLLLTYSPALVTWLHLTLLRLGNDRSSWRHYHRCACFQTEVWHDSCIPLRTTNLCDLSLSSFLLPYCMQQCACWWWIRKFNTQIWHEIKPQPIKRSFNLYNTTNIWYSVYAS